MEESISGFCKILGFFCNHLHSSCDALKQSIERRPIPLDSASSTFIQCLNRRVSTASSDLDLLESMSFGTVSLEELLGHCNEVFKKNQRDIDELEDRLRNTGYVAELDFEEEQEVEVSAFSTQLGHQGDELDSPPYGGGAFAVSSTIKSVEDDPLSDEPLSLKNLGLSDVCLATLASEGNCINYDPDLSLHRPKKCQDTLYDLEEMDQLNTNTCNLTNGELDCDLGLVKVPKAVIKVTEDEYASLPSYLKSLASWEDLLASVEKINSSLSKKDQTKGSDFLHLDEIGSLELGPKGRCFLLLLVRMKCLVIETVDGSITYRVLQTMSTT